MQIIEAETLCPKKGCNMTLVLIQSDFLANLKRYLDQVNEGDETVYISRANIRAAAIGSQEKMNWLERSLKVKEGSLEYVIVRDREVIGRIK